MLQAILEEPGKISLKETPLPEPADGEVLIRVKVALTCGTDLKAYLRGHPLIPMPGPFGHEYSGVVAKVGKSVKDFHEGDPVMGVHSAPCHRCFYCQKGLLNLCENIMKTKVLGAYGEYLLLPAHVVKENLYKKPSNLPFEYAALLEPLACVVHPYSKFSLKDVETALIIGSGPIGLLHLVYLLHNSVEVVVMDKNRQRLEVAKQMGATVCTPEEADSLLHTMTGSRGVGLVVECTGVPEVWAETIRYVRKGGRVVLFGGCPSGTEVSFPTYPLHYEEITLMGSFHYNPEDVSIARDFLIENHRAFGPLLTGKYPLKRISEAFENLKKGNGLKYAIIPDEGGSSL
ncbi:MAG: zinc-binding dehydrogenase [Nitrospirae bacterium]|nr:MAG: zinc-binding dehydrogenase [Nitrospirota bacterium]